MSSPPDVCCVPGCNSKSNMNNDLHFHRLPKAKCKNVTRVNLFGNEEKIDKLQQWLKILNLKKYNPRMKVCSLHFQITDYCAAPDAPVQRRNLNSKAIPSLNLPKNFEHEFKKNENQSRLNRRLKREACAKSHLKKLTQNEATENEAMVQDIPIENTVHDVEEIEVPLMNEPAKDASDPPVLESASSDFDALIKDPVKELLRREKENKEKNKCTCNCHKKQLNFTDLLTSDEKLCTATGISNLKTLEAIVESVKLCVGDRFEKRGLKTRSRIILVYLKMKHNISYRFLALLFNRQSASLCQKIFHTTITVLAQCLAFAIPWPSREEISRNIPTCFEGFEDTRVVLDCTEVFIQQPKDLSKQVMTYSHYKGANTLKFLTGVSPAGLITYVSPAHGGRVSDSAIFNQSTLMTSLESGDAVMVDRGFLIDEQCTKNRWKLIRPPFLRDKKQFSEAEAIATSKIAAARVHVERVNQRIKTWLIVGSKMPANLTKKADDIFKVLCATVNLSLPVLKDEHFIKGSTSTDQIIVSQYTRKSFGTI